MTTSEAFLGLCALGTHGATTIGRYPMRLDEIQQTSPSGFGPRVGSEQDLLPIPIALARTFLTNHFCREEDARDNRSAEVVEAALGSLAALIFVAWCWVGRAPNFPRSSSDIGPGAHARLAASLDLLSIIFTQGSHPALAR